MFKKFTLPIRSVLVLGFGGLMIISLAITLILGFVTATKNTLSLLADNAETMVSSTSDLITDELYKLEYQAHWISKAFSSGYISLNNRDELEKFLVGSLATSEFISGVGFVDENNNIHRLNRNFPTLTAQNIHNSPIDYENIQEQLQNKSGSFWDAPIWLSDSQETIANLRTVIPLPNGEKILFGQGISIKNLSRKLSEALLIFNRTPFVIYDGQYLLAHPNLISDYFHPSKEQPLPRLSDVDDPVIAHFPHAKEARWNEIKRTTNVLPKEATIQGQNYFYLYQTVEGIMDKPLTFGIYLNDSISKPEELTLLTTASIVATLIIILSLIVMWIIARRLERPVLRLAEASEQIGLNNLNETPLLPKSRILEYDQAAQAFNNMVLGLKEREKIRGLFGKIVPARVAEAMLSSQEAFTPHKCYGTILFCDLEGFTALSEKVGPETIVQLLNAFFTDMVEIIEAHGGIITQFQGDAILAVFNVPIEDKDHAAKAISAALSMLSTVYAKRYLGHHLNCRIGINTGDIVAGNVGAESRMNYTVHGDAVNTASRLEAMNKEFKSRILVSETTRKRAPDFDYHQLGEIQIRGKQHPVPLYTLDYAHK